MPVRHRPRPATVEDYYSDNGCASDSLEDDSRRRRSASPTVKRRHKAACRPAAMRAELFCMGRRDFNSTNVPREYVIDILQAPGVDADQSKCEHNTEMTNDGTAEAPSQLPLLIRINSVYISEELATITKSTVACGLVLPPFRILVAFEPEIKARLEELEAQLVIDGFDRTTLQANGPTNEDRAATNSKSEIPNDRQLVLFNASTVPTKTVLESTNPPEPFSKSPIFPEPVQGKEIEDARVSRVRHMRCLVELLDKHLRSSVEDMQKIQTGAIRSVDFASLYMLFKAGDVVLAGQGQMQAYRVFAVRWPASGGEHGPSTPFPAPVLPPLRRINPHPRVDSSSDGESSTSGVAVSPPSGTDPEERAEFYETKSWDPSELDEIRPRSQRPIQQTQEDAFVIHCLSFDFNGKRYGPVKNVIRIRRYEGLRLVTSLSAFPSRFLKGSEDQLLERGKRFVSFMGVAHKQYTGLSLSTPREEVESQVIIDSALGFRLHPQRSPKFGHIIPLPPYAHRPEGCQTCGSFPIHDTWMYTTSSEDFIAQNRMITEITSKPERLGNDRLLLLPGNIFSFVLRTRRWMFLDIDHVKDLNVQEDGFESLVLPKGHKELVRALVETHSRGTRPTSGKAEVKHQVDLVRGKGKGLIILLHGAPGVGKTSTAECVADYTKRPLLPITCGDIGETASEVENNLEKNFLLAHKWGCVLLLDEADVFLSRRDKSDLKRNAIVSVFLRVLEYYSGILFLTTNRVGAFDEAFKSRIHISLYYPPLDKRASLKVWKMNLERTKSKPDFDIDHSDIEEFARDHFKSCKEGGRWNGRQIRNAFQTAIALAEFDAKSDASYRPRLKSSHFEKVAKASAEFDHYLVRVYGGDDDARRAEVDELRHDTFAGPPRFRPMRARDRRPATKASSSESTATESDADTEDNKVRNPKTGKSSKAPAKKDTLAGSHSGSEEKVSRRRRKKKE